MDVDMEIIDCLCGIGVWARRDAITPYDPADILELMDYFGVRKALVYGMLTSHGSGWPVDANRQAIDAAVMSDRFIPALVMGRHAHDGSPTTDDYFSEIRRVNAGGVWLRCPTGGPLRALDAWLIDELLEGCQAHRLPVFLHVEETPLNDVHRICHDFPDLRLILTGAHYTIDDCLFPLLDRHANLHVCLGHFYIPSGGPMHFLNRYGAERLLFGSGMPLFSPGGLIGHINYAPISDAHKALIFGGNLNRLLEERAL